MRSLLSGVVSLLLMGVRDALPIQTLESKDRDRELKLEQTTSGLWLASNRGYPDTWKDINNMLTRWVVAERERRAEPFRAATKKLGFSYIDSYWGDHLVLGDDDSSIEQAFQVVDRTITDKLCDKDLLHLAAKKTGVEGDLVPRTFRTKEEALQELSPDEVDIVFVKERYNTLGNGITILSMQDLRDADIPPDSIIQEGLTKNLALLHGAKVTLRVYFVFMHGRIYVHHMAWIDFQNQLFDPKNTSMEIHLSHAGGTGHLDLRFPRRTPEHVDGSEVIWRAGKHFQVEAVVNGTKWMDGLVEAGRKAGPMLEAIVRETCNDPMRFSFIGADLVPLEDGSFKLLEVNTYPSFRRSDVFTDVILRALHMEKYDSDLETRLVEVWKLPDDKYCAVDSTAKICTATGQIDTGRNPPNDEPFELYEEFSIANQIKGNEGWWDLIIYKTELHKPNITFYMDKVARKRWLKMMGVEQLKIFALKYADEITESRVVEEQAAAILELLPSHIDYVAKPSHLSLSLGTMIVGYDKNAGHTLFDRVAENLGSGAPSRVARTLATHLHKTANSYSTARKVKPGIVVEERLTAHNNKDSPPLEFKIFVIWGRVWIGQYLAVENGVLHIHGYAHRNGTMVKGSGRHVLPEWINWQKLVDMAELQGEGKDLIRVDIFVGVPTGVVQDGASLEERIASVKYVINEVEVSPQTSMFDGSFKNRNENALSREGAQLWIAGYKTGNYRVVSNTEIPPEYLEHGVLREKEDCQDS